MEGNAVETSKIRERLNTAMKNPCEGVGEPLKVTRAFLWYGLSLTIFTNSSNRSMIPLLLALRDIENVGMYSWCEAGLPEIYTSFDWLCRDGKGSFEGLQLVLSRACNWWLSVGHVRCYLSEHEASFAGEWHLSCTRRWPDGAVSLREEDEVRTLLESGAMPATFRSYPWIEIESLRFRDSD